MAEKTTRFIGTITVYLRRTGGESALSPSDRKKWSAGRSDVGAGRPPYRYFRFSCRLRRSDRPRTVAMIRAFLRHQRFDDALSFTIRADGVRPVRALEVLSSEVLTDA